MPSTLMVTGSTLCLLEKFDIWVFCLQEYNTTADRLQLIPVTAKRAAGVQFEVKLSRGGSTASEIVNVDFKVRTQRQAVMLLIFLWQAVKLKGFTWIYGKEMLAKGYTTRMNSPRLWLVLASQYV